MKKFIQLLCVAALAFAGAVYAEESRSQNATGSTSAAVLFDLNGKDKSGFRWKVTGIEATSDAASTYATFQGRKADSTVFTVQSAGATSQAVIQLDRTTGVASNDTVYVKPMASSPGYVGTVIASTSTSLTLSANLTTAVAAGDKVMEIGTIYRVPVGNASINRVGTDIVKTVGDSPLRVVVTGSSACEVNATATVEKGPNQ